MAKKVKGPGRTPGAPNSKSKYLRDETISIKCSQGFNKIVEGLVPALGKKSKADVLHEAIQQLAYRTNIEDARVKYFIDKIQ